MSMGTSDYAEYANAMKEEWIKKLEEASKIDANFLVQLSGYITTISEVRKVIEEMKEFYFTE